MLRSVLTALVTALAACVLPPPAPEVLPDPAARDCRAAERNLRELGCAAAEGSVGPDGQAGTDDDETFLERCEALAEDGLVDPGCWARMTSCGGCD